jgi:hypothetical protein
MSISYDRKSLRIVGVLIVLGMAPSAAVAQFVEPDVSKARVHVGPVMLNPVVELKNFGIDTNVFNEPPDRAKRDFTFTLSPQTELWMRMGRTWMTGNVHEDIHWYQTYTTERAGNTGYTLAWLVPLNRLNVNVSSAFHSVRDRPGFEIDARVQRKELATKGAAELRVLSKTFVGVRGGRERIDFDNTAAFLGTNLRTELNRTVTAGAVTLRHQLTPITSISMDAGRSEDRFQFSSARDSTSTTAGLELRFDPLALIRGTARIGYRHFVPVAADVPSYRGTTAAIDLAYVLLGTTRFGVQAIRDVSYSYDLAHPYYLQTGVQASLAQQIFGPVDVVGRIGLENLAYRERESGAIETVARTDVVHSYGGGFGYHVGDTLRIGFNVDRQRRRSDVAHREFDGMKIGTSITYGF